MNNWIKSLIVTLFVFVLGVLGVLWFDVSQSNDNSETTSVSLVCSEAKVTLTGKQALQMAMSLEKLGSVGDPLFGEFVAHNYQEIWGTVKDIVELDQPVAEYQMYIEEAKGIQSGNIEDKNAAFMALNEKYKEVLKYVESRQKQKTELLTKSTEFNLWKTNDVLIAKAICKDFTVGDYLGLVPLLDLNAISAKDDKISVISK